MFDSLIRFLRFQVHFEIQRADDGLSPTWGRCLSGYLKSSEDKPLFNSSIATESFGLTN